MTNPRDNLDFISDVLQIVNFYLLMRDANNNQIMKELQHQNMTYFEKIVQDLDLIKKHLGIQTEKVKK